MRGTACEFDGASPRTRPDNSAAITFAAWSHAGLGRFDEALALIERAILVDPDNLYTRYNLATAWIAFFKDHDAAMALLEPAFAKAGGTLISLAAADPNIDSIRDDPRFKPMLEAALARCGLKGPLRPPPAD